MTGSELVGLRPQLRATGEDTKGWRGLPVCLQGPTGYKGEQGEVGKDGEKVGPLAMLGLLTQEGQLRGVGTEAFWGPVTPVSVTVATAHVTAG